MKCPNDGTELKMTDRSGVEIDYCPTCRGIWLDKGELDKIIDRASEHYETRSRDESSQREGPYRKESDQYYQGGKPHYYKKKKGFLGDLFDFD